MWSRRSTFIRVETWAQALYSPSSSNIYHHARKAVAYGANPNLLLLFLPLGILGGTLRWNALLVFFFNLLAVIPLSALVSDASDKLSDSVGALLGSLINATFGNSVELTAGILAVVNGRVTIAQSIMIGSILSDILLVLGLCIFSASWGKNILLFNPTVADTLSSLMMIATMAIILPTVLASTLAVHHSQIEDRILSFSRGTAVILLILYITYLFFQMRTHKHLFEQAQHTRQDDPSQSTTQLASPLQKYAPIATLIASSIGVVVCTYFVFESMSSTAHITHMSTIFIAMILIPIASNSPEGSAVIAVSRSGDIDFGISVIVSSILQISLFAIPFLVILGWIIEEPITLDFGSFNTMILFFAVVIVSYMLREGRYTYIHGTMLVGFYAILTVAFYFR
ncbi:hypothetical protein BGW36DRAFT_293456 [Talaromyces proteolyticus]|uniref:Vacuolar calcium ion transporter n=1 Tax=Talaromyces proteolyticus TaxID=1131652 RepID=A0AAD4KZ64_9EURO|nr:uncharacterized protein BGW36DRAFT_293456 [Talaromyces proteolyticus]KAH8699201.1 hypothetical protein BGW36DRAFT_293456 [Talaromyces proteolyticus]